MVFRGVRIGNVASIGLAHDATSGRRVLQWQEQRSVNPASLTKLLTTMAALERLGREGLIKPLNEPQLLQRAIDRVVEQLGQPQR